MERRSFGPVGLAVTAAGLAIGIASFLGMKWIALDTVSGPKFLADFRYLRGVIPNSQFGDDTMPWEMRIYFSWAAFVLFLLCALLAVVASFDFEHTRPVRISAVVLGVFGAAYTIEVERRAVHFAEHPYSDFWRLTRPGFWAAIAAFLLLGLGALLGNVARRAPGGEAKAQE